MAKIRLGNAIAALRNNLQQIHTVKEWATLMGYSRSYFSVLIKQESEKTPYQIICEEKYKKILALVRTNPDQKGWVIAHETGFKNVKYLYNFLEGHFDTNLTKLRNNAISGI